ncbi:SRPBCC family protein [Anatilimnocola floriformis]|uniref:SRPBCC family protein n=1 Tax=Anatilimnocola floriformis TaxID=2948575 RepID=UPI0020C4E732|nr:SRPBCC family protein [Anatilimnocola floriformis]
MIYPLRLWFGVREPVGQAAYAVSGFGLAIFKYVVEAALIWIMVGHVFLPHDFLNPVLSMRTQLLVGSPPWVGWFLFAWSLPFLWIAISMSVRRAADAHLSPWFGLTVILPLVNLVWMVVMCFVPHSKLAEWKPTREAENQTGQAKDAVIALAASLIAGGSMLAISAYGLASYGGSLFIGTPLLMGMLAAFLFNQRQPRGYWPSIGIGLAAVCCGALAMLLFALEGLICIAMALPILAPLGLLGGLLGKMIADTTRRPVRELMCVVLILPGLAWIESRLAPSPEFEVRSAVEIDAPPDVVWRHVIEFPELPPPTEWYFRAGIACPQRARIVGEGVGAVRHCEFTTGAFVEPITVWEPGRRLAFDVVEQPEPMFELTPYRHVHPPHLEGALRSNRGEFRLIELPNGRTRLEGSTWYQIDMLPQSYWTLWSNDLIHRIHLRVLEHVKRHAELDHTPLATE